MDFRKVFSRKRRDELVAETVEFLNSSYPFIAGNALEGRLNDIAAGHLMNLARREELAGGLSKKALGEMDKLFFLMSLRALNIFTRECQGLALVRAVRGEALPGPPIESMPELAGLLEERIKIISDEEELQKKMLLAVASGKPRRALSGQLKKKQDELHELTVEIQKVARMGGAVT
ncbi:MAG: hypothetical protein KAW41_04100 [Candidatus Diapherotrites archaeon]|nr:hypothetical protein [Candidatus Diapherotrites archaeon]